MAKDGKIVHFNWRSNSGTISGRSGRTEIFFQKSHKSTHLSEIFVEFLRKSLCLPKSEAESEFSNYLIFLKSEPSVLINRVLTKKSVYLSNTNGISDTSSPKSEVSVYSC